MTFKTSILRLLRCLRIVLVIPMAVLEVLALLLGWIIAFIHKPTAKLWCEFYMRILPDPKWYYAGYRAQPLTIADVTPKMRVAYIPGHAFGDKHHEDVEHGTVSSHNGINVFVKFDKFDKQVSVLGWDDTTSQSCTPSDLVKL